jgi:hypothetical protein
MRGFCHGLQVLFLPVSAGRPCVAVRYAPLGVAKRLRRRVPDHTGVPLPTAKVQPCAHTLCRSHKKPLYDACEHISDPSPTSAPGFTLNVGRPKVPCRSRVGCHGHSCGGGTDRSRADAARGAIILGPAVATAHRCGSNGLRG